jgi:hypothetical protein
MAGVMGCNKKEVQGTVAKRPCRRMESFSHLIDFKLSTKPDCGSVEKAK